MKWPEVLWDVCVKPALCYLLQEFYFNICISIYYVYNKTH